MGGVTLAATALGAFVVGFYLGRRAVEAQYREQMTALERQYQKVIDFADEYIEANAPRRALHVIRNADGHIVELLMRCGTSALLAKEMLQEKQLRRALH